MSCAGGIRRRAGTESVAPSGTARGSPGRFGTATPGRRGNGNGDGGRPDAGEAILVATKLHPPTVRGQSIRREPLLERLRSGSDRKLTLVACPAGFGKTTLLAAWRDAEAARKPVAWLTLDDGDNDPVVLWSHAIGALRQARPGVAGSVSADTVVAPVVEVVLPGLVNELDGQGEMALILDDYHRLSSVAARASVRWFIEHAPPQFQLVLATRTSKPAGGYSARPWRAARAPSRRPALYPRGGGRLPQRPPRARPHTRRCRRLVGKTEGWPAGLYLAALSLAPAVDRHEFVRTFGGSNRHVLDFLVTEVLEAHDPPTQALMLRTSILERLSGPLCDAVMEQEGSAATLEALSRSNLFLVPLDQEGGWYRFHHVFAQLLRVELERRHPGLAPTLHRRAYSWHRDHGTTDETIQHAVAAEAYAEVVELIKTYWITYANTCRYDTVLAWLGGPRRDTDRRGASAPGSSVGAVAVGSTRGGGRAVAAVERLGDLSGEPLPDGFSSAEASLTMLLAGFPGECRRPAGTRPPGRRAEGPGSPWRPLACWAVGMGLYFRGEADEADRWFAESAALAPASAQWLCGVSSLAFRSGSPATGAA